MRASIVIPVLVGLSLVTLPAMADRFHRDRHFRDYGGRPDRPGRAIERSRPGDDLGRMTMHRVAPPTRMRGRTFERHTSSARPAFTPGRVPLYLNTSSRKTCNEAGGCTMSHGAVKAAVARAARSRPTGVPGVGQVNNARGKSLLGRAAPSARMVCNEADACSMSRFSAQALVFQAANSRAPGTGSTAKLNNARGKSLLGRAAPSARMACNEADACSMNNSGAKAEWQKAEAQRRR